MNAVNIPDEKKVKSRLRLAKLLNALTIKEVEKFSKDHPQAEIVFSAGKPYEIITIVDEYSINEKRIIAMHEAQNILLQELNDLLSQRNDLNDRIRRLKDAKEIYTFPQPEPSNS